jgi:SAM-dependent methyltransferase
MSNAISFGRQAATYAKGRPTYPDALFEWIAENSPSMQRALDIATGSGQAAQTLVKYFDHVDATDIDPAQIKAATPHAHITYHTAPADQSGLPKQSVDAINVATALHWFAGEAFWLEITRIAKPGAFFCAYVYSLAQVEGPIQTDYLDPLFDRLAPYWSAGNHLAMSGYTAENTYCPFQTVNAPQFDAGGLWTAGQLMDFIESWSAHLRARDDGHAKALAEIRQAVLFAAGETPLKVSLPLSILAAKIE